LLDGAGTVTADGRELRVDGPGAYELVSHPVSTAAELELSVGDGVRCYAVCFTPGRAVDERRRALVLEHRGEPRAIGAPPRVVAEE